MPIQFFDADRPSRLKQKRLLKSYMTNYLNETHQAAEHELSYIFCSDEYLLKINKDFLQHDDFTDIITFDLSTDPSFLMSEIYISTERVAENATQYGVTYQDELHRVIFHGMLHLCGYTDKGVKQAALMRAKEDECLKAYSTFLAGKII